MGLSEKALADLVTTQHETSEKVQALADSLAATSDSLDQTRSALADTVSKTRHTAELANALVGQLDRNAEATAELIKHLGGIAPIAGRTRGPGKSSRGTP